MEENNSLEPQNLTRTTPLLNPDQTPPIHKKSKIILWILAPLTIVVLISSFIYGFVKGIPETKLESMPPSTSIPPATIPTPDPTFNWKVFTGDGFGFRYPADWNDHDGGDTISNSFCLDLDCTEVNQNFTEISVNVIPNQKNLTLYEFGEQETTPDKVLNPGDEKYEARQPIDGHSAISGVFATGNYAIITIIEDGNRFIQFLCKSCSDEINNQILSTFKFSTENKIPLSRGESCGPNAGQAGDAQCETGLTCVFETEQIIKDRIGTCKASN